MKRLGSFFDEIYGFDGMSSFLLFISVILNLVTGMWPSQVVNNFNLISYLPLLGCIFRVFSRNHERRAHENECFLKLARPLCENIIEKREEQAEAKLFRFFKCPVCKQKLRVPNLISYLPLLGCIFRVFSRNHERRAHENECFLKLARPLCENIIEKREEQAEAKLFRFFKCPVCKQKLRVPKGKGKVEITCPKCGNKFIKKA